MLTKIAMVLVEILKQNKLLLVISRSSFPQYRLHNWVWMWPVWVWLASCPGNNFKTSPAHDQSWCWVTLDGNTYSGLAGHTAREGRHGQDVCNVCLVDCWWNSVSSCDMLSGCLNVRKSEFTLPQHSKRLEKSLSPVIKQLYQTKTLEMDPQKVKF